MEVQQQVPSIKKADQKKFRIVKMLGCYSNVNRCCHEQNRLSSLVNSKSLLAGEITIFDHERVSSTSVQPGTKEAPRLLE